MLARGSALPAGTSAGAAACAAWLPPEMRSDNASRTLETTVKSAVLAPMHTASVTKAVRVKVLCLTSSLNAMRRSCMTEDYYARRSYVVSALPPLPKRASRAKAAGGP